MVGQAMQYPTIPRDYLLVKVDKQYENEVEVAGNKLQLDTSFDPNWHVRIYGEIVQLPKCVTLYDKQGNVKDEAGIGTLHDVQVGDKVYFHFHTVHEENRIKYLTEQNIYKLHHKQMFCVVRDGRIIMCNDRVLVQPKMESWDDIKSASGLILKSEPEPIPLVGVIKHIGKPAPGYQAELQAGDEIYFSRDSEFKNKIEDEEYYVMSQSDIVGKYFSA